MGNEFERLDKKPANWDINSSENAFEIAVDGKTPVFQMIRRDENTIEVDGVFNNGRDTEYVTPEGMLHNPLKPPGSRGSQYKALGLIFKYPSWKYPGVYAAN